MQTRKAELLSAAAEYLAENGVADLSLRPMAAAIGTSARLLIFHFGSKERLVQEAMAEVQHRLQTSFVSMIDAGPRRVAPLKRFWHWATRPENLPYVRLLYEVQIIAIQNPEAYGVYLRQSSMDWLGLAVQAMSASARTTTMATLCIAVFDGLFLELLSTGDHARLTRALDRFIAMAHAARGYQPSPPARRQPSDASSRGGARPSRSKRS
jgi:AcrR family transcriptional regulator